VRHHHERLDGTGYPDGLRGDDIPMGARIISVADTFDAITSNRAYRSKRRHRQALDVVSEEAGSRLDPDAAAAFLRYYSGRRVVAWSAFGLTGPPRIATSASALFNGVGGAAAPLAQGLAAIVAAALAGGALHGQPTGATAASDRASAGAGGSPLASDLRGGSDLSPLQGTDGVPRRLRVRVGERPGSRPVQDAPGDGSSGLGVPPDSTGDLPPTDPSPVPIVEVPSVDVPIVEVPSVEVPTVELPDLDALEPAVPNLKLQPVELPPIKVPLG
jgi:hypothetical protein